jgi:hypothetical protein
MLELNLLILELNLLLQHFLQHKCPHTATYVPSSCYICILSYILLHMCPQTAQYVFILLYLCPHYCMCVLMLLVCPHTTMCILKQLDICRYTTIYVSLTLLHVSSYSYLRVLILLICVLTLLYVSSYSYMIPV